MFPDRFATPEWQATIREIVPGFGTQLNTEPELFRSLLSQTTATLQLELPEHLPEPA